MAYTRYSIYAVARKNTEELTTHLQQARRKIEDIDVKRLRSLWT